MSEFTWTERRIASCMRDLAYEVAVDRPLSELRAEAAESHSRINPRAKYDLMSDGVLVAHLRHEYTPYEWNLWEMRRRQGAVEVQEVSDRCHALIQARTNAAIKRRFPELGGSAT